MRYLGLGFLLFVIGCSEHKQQSNNNNLKNDTAKLFDPNPQAGIIYETGAVLCNCLMLEDEKIAAGIRCERFELRNEEELKDLLEKNVADINKQKFFIVYSNNTTKKRIIDIIKIVKDKNISDYKVINLQGLSTLYVPQQ